MAIAGAGEAPARTILCEFIQRRIQYFKYKDGLSLTTHAVANYARTFLADSLRERMFACDSLIGGFHKDEGPSLYYLDYLATLQKVNKTAFGYGAYFILTVMDTQWKEVPPPLTPDRT